jgi:hypothetical protein
MEDFLLQKIGLAVGGFIPVDHVIFEILGGISFPEDNKESQLRQYFNTDKNHEDHDSVKEVPL